MLQLGIHMNIYTRRAISAALACGLLAQQQGFRTSALEIGGHSDTFPSPFFFYFFYNLPELLFFSIGPHSVSFHLHHLFQLLLDSVGCSSHGMQSCPQTSSIKIWVGIAKCESKMKTCQRSEYSTVAGERDLIFYLYSDLLLLFSQYQGRVFSLVLGQRMPMGVLCSCTVRASLAFVVYSTFINKTDKESKMGS